MNKANTKRFRKLARQRLVCHASRVAQLSNMFVFLFLLVEAAGVAAEAARAKALAEGTGAAVNAGQTRYDVPLINQTP
jgi:hypothetical protein